MDRIISQLESRLCQEAQIIHFLFSNGFQSSKSPSPFHAIDRHLPKIKNEGNNSGYAWCHLREILWVLSSELCVSEKSYYLQMDSLNQMKFFENSSEIARWRNHLGYKLLKANCALPGLSGSICEHQPCHQQTWKAGQWGEKPQRQTGPRSGPAGLSMLQWCLWVPLSVVQVHMDLYNWKAPTHGNHLDPTYILVQNHRMLSKSAKQNFLNIHFQLKPPIMGVWNLLPLW